METATADVLTSELDAPEEVGSDVVLLARQPILDTSNRIRGHELIFRREDGSDWPITDDNAATAHVLTAFATTGRLEQRVRVTGRLMLTRRDGQWKVFAYHVNKGDRR